MTHPRQHPLPAHADPSHDDIAPMADLDEVLEILRQAHPELDAEDLVARVREIMETSGG